MYPPLPSCRVSGASCLGRSAAARHLSCDARYIVLPADPKPAVFRAFDTLDALIRDIARDARSLPNVPGATSSSAPRGAERPGRLLTVRILSLIHISEPTRLGM